MSVHQLLDKLGLKFTDLTSEERDVYEQWNRILTAPAVTIEDLKRFIPVQLQLMRRDQNDFTNSKDKDIFLKAAIRNLEMIQAFILGPEKKREWLANYIDRRKNQIK